MTSKYWLKHRQDMLTWCKDFSDPQNQIRYVKDVRKLKHWDWFWCHPSAYSLIHFGAPLISIVIYMLGLAYFIKRDSSIGIIICGLLSAFMIHRITKKIREKDLVKNFTFYDMYLRDFEYDELIIDSNYYTGEDKQ